jgi:hypothetical protein
MIIKGQVYAGSWSKGYLTSGLKCEVRICYADQNRDYAKQMTWHNLTTHKNAKAWLLVKSVLVLESIDIKKQFF